MNEISSIPEMIYASVFKANYTGWYGFRYTSGPNYIICKIESEKKGVKTFEVWSPSSYIPTSTLNQGMVTSIDAGDVIATQGSVNITYFVWLERGERLYFNLDPASYASYYGEKVPFSAVSIEV